MRSKYINAVVLGRRAVTDRIAEFQIGAVDGQRLPLAEAGTHLELRFGGDGGRFVRHYSIVGPLNLNDEPEPFWRIAVQRENRSRGSAFIHEQFKAGTGLQVSHPINVFRLARGQPHTLLIAGGIGITPMLAMARSLRTRKADFSMLYAGVERPAMAYVGELERLCDGRLTVQETKLNGKPDLQKLLTAQPAGTMAYVCGPSSMIEAVREAGARLGWDKDRIRFEVFNSAHRPDDEDFQVRVKSGRTIKVGAGTTILEALEAAGIDTLSDCRRGECGLCVTKVVSADGRLDHRDRFFSDAERAAGDHITICCSRITGRALELDI